MNEETEIGAGAGAESAGEVAAGTGTELGGRASTEPAARASTKSAADAGARASTEPGARPSTEPGARPSTEPGARPSTEPGARSSAEFAAEAVARASTEPAAEAAARASTEPAGPAGYRRSAGTPRAQARRRELLDRVTDDLAEHGLVDFSLRRAAKAAGTTHKVLLYHFDGAEDLLREAVEQLRERRLASSMAAAFASDQVRSLAGRVRAVWPVLTGSEEGQRALDQALGLAMYDPDRHASLAIDAAGHFLPALREMCPPQWSDQRKDEVAELVFAALRGFLVQRRTGGSDGGSGGEAGLEALLRMLDREEAAG